ncbi:MAG: MarR family transcriptional regulator [Gemmatimonadota bacterium]|nr:MarR family transcriptional regulator [Gemmatimonadota bacterium]
MKSRRGKDEAFALADQIHSAAIHLLRQLRKEDDASGISAPRLSALSVVVFGGPLTLGQLAAAEQVRPPTMTRIVAGLEKDGLVKKKGDARDRRLTRIYATPKGEKVLAAGRARRVTLLAGAIERLRETELAELGRGAQLLRELIDSMRRTPR